MIRVKICGMMSPDHVALCASAGAHALGFVVEYPVDVPWNLTRRAAAELVAQVPPFVASCMVTAGSPETVVDLAAAVRPDTVQLHGDETVEETARIAGELLKMGIRTIKALRTDSRGRLRFPIPDAGEAARVLSGTGIHALLVDASTPHRPGGSGMTVDSRVYRAVREAAGLPVILAGGLRADNLHQVLPADCPPFAVDVLTGVESGAGVKDPGKVAALLRAVGELGTQTV